MASSSNSNAGIWLITRKYAPTNSDRLSLIIEGIGTSDRQITPDNLALFNNQKTRLQVVINGRDVVVQASSDRLTGA